MVDSGDAAMQCLFHERPVEITALQSVDDNGVDMNGFGISHVQTPPFGSLVTSVGDGPFKKLQPILAPIQRARVDICRCSEYPDTLRFR